MNKKQEANALVIECITNTLLNMMKNQSFDTITITDLTESAGVGRVSFYRNFDSKKEVLSKHLTSLMQEWSSKLESLDNMSLFSDSLIRHYYNHRDFYLLLYRQGLWDMIYETLRNACKREDAKSNLERYGTSMFAGMLFGWIDEWMRQGMPESPDEIVLLTLQANNAPT